MGTKQIDDQTLELRKTLVSNIKRFRKELHLTREAFAEKSGISMSYLSDIEQCRTWVSDKTLVKLAAALYKKPFELLLSLENDNNNTTNQENQLTNIISEQRKEVLKQTEKLFDETLQKVLLLR